MTLQRLLKNQNQNLSATCKMSASSAFAVLNSLDIAKIAIQVYT